jgi:predicted nicotinamide N-methyase
VIELGSGLGLTAAALEIAGARGIVTELPSILDNLQYNVSRNTSGCVSVRALDVQDTAAVENVRREFHPDVVVAADGNYHHVILYV